MLMTFVVISVLIAATAFWIMIVNLIELTIINDRLQAEYLKQKKHEASVAKLAKQQEALLEEHNKKETAARLAKSVKSSKMVG